MAEGGGKTSTGLQENVAGLLCYLGWWITGVIFLLIEKENTVVKFHAWQSIVVCGILFVLSLVLSWIPVVGIILWLLSVIVWIFLMYKAYKGGKYMFPIAGAIAEKLAK